MWEFRFQNAINLAVATWPFFILRTVAATLSTLIFLALVGSGGFLAYEFAEEMAPGGGLGAALFGAMFGIWMASNIIAILNEYVLYLIKAAHIAVLVDFLDGNPVAAKAQFTHGRAVVDQRFMETSLLFVLDQLIKGILRAFARMTEKMAGATLIPGAKLLASMVDVFLHVALSFVDEVILAHNIRTRQENPWQGSVDALLLYFKNGRAILKNALWLTLFLGFVALVIALVFIAPYRFGFIEIPQDAIPYSALAGLAIFWIISSVLLETLAITCLVELFFKITKGQQPDPEWEATIVKYAPTFMDLKTRASQWEKTEPVPLPDGKIA